MAIGPCRGESVDTGGGDATWTFKKKKNGTQKKAKQKINRNESKKKHKKNTSCMKKLLGAAPRYTLSA